MAAAAAEKHGMIVGLQFADPAVVKQQLAASKLFRMDPDIGDLTKNKIDALQFVRDNYPSISSLDLKDATLGGPSVPFGEGDSQMKSVLRFLKEKAVSFTAYIDCDYPGTGKSIEEVQRCVTYARESLAPVH